MKIRNAQDAALEREGVDRDLGMQRFLASLGMTVEAGKHTRFSVAEIPRLCECLGMTAFFVRNDGALAWNDGVFAWNRVCIRAKRY